MSRGPGKDLSSDSQDFWGSIDKVTAACRDKTAHEIYDAVKNSLSSIAGKDSVLTELFGYSGFDVITFRRMISEKVSEIDVMILCMFGMMRGNNIKRIIKSTNSKEAAARLTDLAFKSGSLRGLESTPRGWITD